MTVTIMTGDARDVLAGLPEQTVRCCVLEPTPDAYVAEQVLHDAV